MSNFILIIVYLIIGYSIKNIAMLPANLAKYLNKFVIYFSLPSMILLQIPKLDFSSEAFIPIFIAWLVMMLSAILVYVTAKFLHFSKEITGSLMLVAVLTNSSFVGLPLISAYLGTEALPYIIIYDQLGTFLALATYGTVVTAYYSSKSEVNFKMIVYKILLFPPFVALILAMFLIDVDFIPIVEKSLQLCSETIIPFALVAVGLQMQFQLPKEEVKPFTIALVLKLIIAPMIALFICYIFAWEGLVAQVAIMEAGMAPMITAAAMASHTGLAPRLSNAIVGYGILISFVTTYVLYLIVI